MLEMRQNQIYKSIHKQKVKLIIILFVLYLLCVDKFDPRTIIFNSIADIPLHLLKDIANLYIQVYYYMNTVLFIRYIREQMCVNIAFIVD